MRSYVQVLTTPTADTPGTTLLLHFDNKRYLVGSLAEGTQRACVQMGARLLKVSECFLTGRTEWRNTGGLIGMILTLADSAAASQAASLAEAMRKAHAKAKKLGVADDAEKVKALEDEAKTETRNTFTVFGPPNLNHTLATARRYVFRKGMPVDIHEIRDTLGSKLQASGKTEEEWGPYWADDNIKVWPMSISPSNGKSQASRPSPPSLSPRKRSIDEVYAQEQSSHGVPTVTGDDLTPEERDYLEVKAVVSEMFNSSWRLDTLFETRLSDVRLPATIFVRNPETNKIEKYAGPLPGGPQPPQDPNLKVLVRRPWPGALVESLPKTKPAKEAISYIIKNHMQRGKFNPQKAKGLKVKQGPAWAQLVAGNNVTNEDGETITPDMVLGESKEGGGIAVIDVPNPDYIEGLINRPEWRETSVMSGVGAVVWICGKHVGTDPRLHTFMEEFKHLKHIVSSPDYCSNYIALDSAAAATIRLKQVDPDRYGVPVHDVESIDDVQKYGGNAKFLTVRKEHPLPGDVAIAARGQQVQLEPSIAVKSDQVIPTLDVAETEAGMTRAVLDEAAKVQDAIAAPDEDMQKWLASLPPGARDTEIITLGTGSALPSKYRNVSATLVRVPNWGNVLLDCGENTMGQLKRVFTDDEFKQVLRELKIIFISHMHADHQLGTTSIIKAWYEEVHGSQPAPRIPDDAPISPTILSQNRLTIMSEPAMLHWLAEYSAVEDFGHSHLAPLTISPPHLSQGRQSQLAWFISPSELKDKSGAARSALMDSRIVPASAVNLEAAEAVAVQHCHGARAVSLTFPSGMKVSYSGDCRPSTAFSRIGRGSTVCIHEATFDDELQGDAQAKNHSTTSEALGVAQAMRARACVLTHFSQRYQKVPVLERGDAPVEDAEEERGSDDNENDDDAPSSGEPLEDGENPMMADDGGDTAATLPDQAAAAANGAGKQYALPSSTTTTTTTTGAVSEAVKFRVTSDMKVCVAFDYMRVKIGDIGHLEKFTPALLKLFAEEETAKAEEGAAQHQQQQQQQQQKKNKNGGGGKNDGGATTGQSKKDKRRNN